MQGVEVLDAECYYECCCYHECYRDPQSSEPPAMWCLKAFVCLCVGMLLGSQSVPKDNTTLAILEAHTCNNFAMNAVSMTTTTDEGASVSLAVHCGTWPLGGWVGIPSENHITRCGLGVVTHVTKTDTGMTVECSDSMPPVKTVILALCDKRGHILFVNT